jgi:DNA-binding transcriptional ArsR family regulator
MCVSMSKPITEIDDPRLVKALAHPLRIRILGVLEQRSATPKELAELLDVQLENLSYHVRTLRDFGFIKLERRRMVKGAVEHRYGMVARPRITAAAWEQLPAIVREALDAASLEQIWDVVSRAAAQDKMSRPESHMARRVARLDEQGAGRDVQGGRRRRRQARRDREAVGAAPAQAQQRGDPDGARRDALRCARRRPVARRTTARRRAPVRSPVTRRLARGGVLAVELAGFGKSWCSTAANCSNNGVAPRSNRSAVCKLEVVSARTTSSIDTHRAR